MNYTTHSYFISKQWVRRIQWLCRSDARDGAYELYAGIRRGKVSIHLFQLRLRIHFPFRLGRVYRKQCTFTHCLQQCRRNETNKKSENRKQKPRVRR